MSSVQIFGQISDQNALFLMERGGVGWNIFALFFLVDSLGLERTRKWFVIDIMYRKMRKTESWSENDSIGEYAHLSSCNSLVWIYWVMNEGSWERWNTVKKRQRL